VKPAATTAATARVLAGIDATLAAEAAADKNAAHRNTDRREEGTQVTGPERYRKKPVVVEAMQVPDPDDLQAWGALAGWLMARAEFEVAGPAHGTGVDGLLIKTLEGVMRAEIGDWVIRGVQGEFYPCKPDIFAATYEPEARR
jgi:hypothetical protein